MIQIHDPEFAPSLDIILNETLPALAKLRESGKVKMIGMTGYPMGMQKYLIEHSKVKIDTCLTYCHYSMNDTSLLGDLPFLKSKGLGVINASPISMGLLSHRGPPKWHPAKDFQKKACADAAKYCEEQGVDISTLAMAFTLANADIPTTLVSTASLERCKANIASVTYKLSAKEAEVSAHILATYFKPLEGRSVWEGEELQAYWLAVGRRLLIEKQYPSYTADSGTPSL